MTLAHWIYALGTIVVVLTMILRRNVVIPCIVSTFLIGLIFHGSLVPAVQALFNACMAALGELGSIFVIIGLMYAMLQSLSVTGADELLVAPLKVYGFTTYQLCYHSNRNLCRVCFLLADSGCSFSRCPTCSNSGKSGLTPMAGAVAIALAGQGMALSGDIVIQGANNLSAKSAGIPVQIVNNYVFILSLVTGIIAIAIAYYMMRKDIACSKRWG